MSSAGIAAHGHADARFSAGVHAAFISGRIGEAVWADPKVCRVLARAVGSGCVSRYSSIARLLAQNTARQESIR